MMSGSRLPQRNPSRAALKPAAIPPNVAIARSVDIASDEMPRALPRAPMKGHTIPTPVFKPRQPARPSTAPAEKDRKSVVQGKSVSVRVDLGGRRIIKKKRHEYTYEYSVT